MQVSDILRVKGGTLYTVTPEQSLFEAIQTMAERDIGSLVVMDHGLLVGMLTFREVLAAIVQKNGSGDSGDSGGSFGRTPIRAVMDRDPMSCSDDAELDDVRRMMLERHARYMPVMSGRVLMGVISFYDVARAVVDAQDFENRLLKAYIRDWPAEGVPSSVGASG